MAKYVDIDALGIGYANRDVFDSPAYADGWNSAIKILSEAPAADVHPVIRGHWLDDGFNDKCSNCGFACDDMYYLGEANYCPNCGADMREVDT